MTDPSAVDLTTRYLRLELPSPLVAAASPLSQSLANIRHLEAAGAGAVVLYSLFEEQIRADSYRFRWFRTQGLEPPPDELRHAPPAASFATDPLGYLNHFQRARDAVRIPVIPSLNGATMGGWTRYARLLQEAGAPALELNLYLIPTDPETPGSVVEDGLVEILRAVREAVEVPLAVKVGPYFSSFAHLAGRLAAAGADGLVLFNRFYQPDLDIEARRAVPRPLLSTPSVLRLPLRWISILSGRLPASLAASGGVLRGEDVLKVILAGADVAMVCSALLHYGIGELAGMEEEVRSWLAAHGHRSLDEIRGAMSEAHTPDSAAFERGHYIRAIQGPLDL